MRRTVSKAYEGIELEEKMDGKDSTSEQELNDQEIIEEHDEKQEPQLKHFSVSSIKCSSLISPDSCCFGRVIGWMPHVLL